MSLGSEIRDPEKNLCRIPDAGSGSRGQKGTGSRTRIRNTAGIVSLKSISGLIKRLQIRAQIWKAKKQNNWEA
jgi:hypothetical protein